jgi:hypothetical protein
MPNILISSLSRVEQIYDKLIYLFLYLLHLQVVSNQTKITLMLEDEVVENMFAKNVVLGVKSLQC